MRWGTSTFVRWCLDLLKPLPNSGSHVHSYNSLYSSKKAFHCMLEHGCGDLLPFSHKNICEVRHGCWTMYPGSQLPLKIISAVLDGAEVIALSRAVRLFLTKVGNTFISGHVFYTGSLSGWGGKMVLFKLIQQKHRILYKNFIYFSNFPLLKLRGPNPERQAQNTIPPVTKCYSWL